MKRRSKSILAAVVMPVLLGAGVIIACGGPDNLPPPPPPPPVPATDGATTVSTVAQPPSTAPAPPKAPPPPVTLTLGAASPDPTGALPTVAITAPAKEAVVPNDKAAGYSVKLDVKNWPTATGSSHVHLILDNKPYKAIFDPKVPVKLSELTNGEEIKEGRHVLVAFPSRANHESVKTKGALAVVPFWVGKKGDAKDDFTKKPMLVYSRPKGEYKGELANHVLIDFYLSGVTLAEGKEHVNVKVTGPGIDKPLEAKATKWGPPFYLDNLQNGSYEIKTELVDGSDKPIEGPWNSTTRSIKIDHDAPADPIAAHGGHDPDAGAPPKGATSAPMPPPTMTNQQLPPMGGSGGAK
ncbi:MAG: hypothetical protein KIT84_26315 [Labilithrix sp.]|nr:hypothetical protein [Labilithrix sp.]MCW5814570.1 hypothetical protein [Labilithrix sp.]